MRALVIEDEVDIARAISRSLGRIGLEVDVATTGADGLWLAGEGHYAVIVLDLGLPEMTGSEVCRRLRARGVSTPILVVTAQVAESDEIEMLRIGADDFIRKPFSIDVLIARASALVRRGESRAGPRRFGGIEYDPESRTCAVDDQVVHLTPRETQVLATLLHAGERPVSKTELLHAVWGTEFDVEPNVVDVYIRYLRQKIGPDRIETIPRVGFRIRQTQAAE